MKKILLVNGIITLTGVLLDIIGYIDLSRFTATLGLLIGVTDVVSFIWIYRRLKKKQ